MFGLDAERMNIKNGAIIIQSFNDADYGLYECVLAYEAYNNHTKKYANKLINLTRESTKNIFIDRFRQAQI